MSYSTMTLGDLIDALNALPDGAKVRGLSGEVESYRGYYERNAIEPSSDVRGAHELAASLAREIGKPITGYKGGDYTVSERENVYCAARGDVGPNVCGLIPAPDGVYEPLLGEVSEW